MKCKLESRCRVGRRIHRKEHSCSGWWLLSGSNRLRRWKKSLRALGTRKECSGRGASRYLVVCGDLEGILWWSRMSSRGGFLLNR